jgi:hypothetical protein
MGLMLTVRLSDVAVRILHTAPRRDAVGEVYIGWQDSLAQLAIMVGPQISD